MSETAEDASGRVEERLSVLEDELETIETEYIKPEVVEIVLSEAGLSDDRAEDLVETMHDVQAGLGDSDV